MSNLSTLLKRNKRFNASFNHADLTILPSLKTLILSCTDARVDPAHILHLNLGESIVMRNTGGRVTKEIIDQILLVAFMAKKMNAGPIEVLILHHTNCGAERFADPGFQKLMKQHTSVDVARFAITNHKESLKEDIQRLKCASGMPPDLMVAGCLYDVGDGSIDEIFKPSAIGK